MLIQRRSVLSGNINEMDLDITDSQLEMWLNGFMVQDAFPHLSADEREFLISGMSVPEQEWFFKNEDEC